MLYYNELAEKVQVFFKNNPEMLVDNYEVSVDYTSGEKEVSYSPLTSLIHDIDKTKVTEFVDIFVNNNAVISVSTYIAGDLILLDEREVMFFRVTVNITQEVPVTEELRDSIIIGLEFIVSNE